MASKSALSSLVMEDVKCTELEDVSNVFGTSDMDIF